MYRIDLQNLYFDLDFLTPKLTYTSQYSVSQKLPILNIELRGYGEQSGVLSKNIACVFILCLDMLFFRRNTWKNSY